MPYPHQPALTSAHSKGGGLGVRSGSSLERPDCCARSRRREKRLPIFGWLYSTRRCLILGIMSIRIWTRSEGVYGLI
jgi:hypothetical protein